MTVQQDDMATRFKATGFEALTGRHVDLQLVGLFLWFKRMGIQRIKVSMKLSVILKHWNVKL